MKAAIKSHLSGPLTYGTFEKRDPELQSPTLPVECLFLHVLLGSILRTSATKRKVHHQRWTGPLLKRTVFVVSLSGLTHTLLANVSVKSKFLPINIVALTFFHNSHQNYYWYPSEKHAFQFFAFKSDVTHNI